MKVRGRVQVPGDKSISHRALIFSSLARGRSRVRGILASADVRSTAGVCRALGVAVPALSADMTIESGGAESFRAPTTDLDCGNSGTTARLMAGVAAACPFESHFIGDQSLSRRPMRRVARPLSAMGASIELTQRDRLPMRVRGGMLRPLDWESETASAQVKSAILLAGLVAGTTVTVNEPVRSRDHTERMLAALGARIVVEGTRVRLLPGASLSPLDLTVPADPSSAAFLAALAALADEGSIELPRVCVNPTRTGFYALLERMGAQVRREGQSREGGEEVATLRVTPAGLRGTSVGGRDVPSLIDELPLVACLAARAEGVTEISGAEELRVKESDRIATVVTSLRVLGADAEERPDGMVVRGHRRPLRGRVITHGDHRIAMAFGVLGALPGNEIDIDDPACVDVSYPQFWSDLASVIVR
jgi:3-phosphoshikimate 1-carboxyvinyltransferase